MRYTTLEDGSIVQEGTRYICSDGEFFLMDVGGKPRWVKNVKDDGAERMWDKLPKAEQEKVQAPGFVVEYL